MSQRIVFFVPPNLDFVFSYGRYALLLIVGLHVARLTYAQAIGCGPVISTYL